MAISVEGPGDDPTEPKGPEKRDVSSWAVMVVLGAFVFVGVIIALIELL